MKRALLTTFFLCSWFLALSQEAYEYPKPTKANQYDTLFGKAIHDPYRWMEKPSAQVDEWLSSQAGLLTRYKRKQLKIYPAVYNDLRSYGQVDYKPLIKQGKSFYFYQYNSYYASPALYRQPSYNGNSWMVLDPRLFEQKGETVSIMGFQVSPDERYMAFSLSRSGSDWREIRVKDIPKGKYLDDVIKWVKYSSIYWHGDGFFYWKYEVPESGQELLAMVKNQQLYYHKVGTTQEEDQLIFEIGKAFFNSAFEVTSDQKYLVLYTFEKIKDEWKKVIMLKDLEKGTDFETLLEYPKEEVHFSLIDHIDGKFYLLSDYEASNSRILSMDLATKELVEVVPELDQTIEEINIIANKIVTLYFSEGRYIVAVFDLEGKPLATEALDVGFDVSGFEGTNNDTESLYFVRSFYFPTVVYKINFEENKIELLSETGINYDHKQFETQYVKYKSSDGQEVPMYLTYKKGTDLKSRNNPVLLYAYGGFGVPLTPHYDQGYILFLKSGGILATPLIRGGGEFGNDWHDAGRLLNKQQSFDDFTAAAVYLIQTRVTNPQKIAINGGSNGGLLVGAALTQRPELFKAAVPEMGLFDMLRYDRFGINYIHRDEYGSPRDSTEFLNLLGYSPYHNIRPEKKYPATLVITADNDDRVPPLHSYKFLSRLQETSSEAPFLLKLETEAGHYGASTLNDSYSTEALKWSFILTQLGMKPK